jgi:RNA-directed DNA polymerase
MKARPHYALKADIHKGFDRSDPDALWATTQASPVLRRQRKAWLQAGILEDNPLFPPTVGTPQGGARSPLVALLALHGMEEAITHVDPQARGIAYADDVVGLHEDRKVLEHCQQRLMTWLADIGLALPEAQSPLSHPLEGDQPGLDFLGCNIRQSRVGHHQSGQHSTGNRLGLKTLIKPAKANIATR